MSAWIPIVSTLVGGVIGLASATWIAWINGRRVAGARLRSAFAPELAIVRTYPHADWVSLERILGDPQKDLQALLTAAFQRHSIAIEEYRPFVPRRRQKSYEEAWRGYYLAGGSISFTAYAVDEDGSEQFCSRIERIFRFTKT
jgi:hypothetical protein